MRKGRLRTDWIGKRRVEEELRKDWMRKRRIEEGLDEEGLDKIEKD